MSTDSLIAKLEKSKHDLPSTAHNHPRAVGWNEGVDNCISVIRQHEADHSGEATKMVSSENFGLPV